MSDLSEEQRLMRQSCRDFVDAVIIPFIRKDWQREWLMTPEDRLPPEILEGAEKVGIRTLGVPEEFGGIELDPKSEVQTFALIAEEIARGDSGLADKLVQNWKVSVLLRNLAPRHLQEKWFERLLANPQFLLAHCLTEPRGASDRWLPYNVPEAAMQTRAVRKNSEWIINGRKQFISNGYDAGLFVVYANTNPQVGMMQGTSSFLVPRDTPGLTVARCNETVGCRFMNNGELVFEDLRVPADHLLVEGEALGKAAVYFRPGKIIQAAKNLGVGVRAFEVASDYVQSYVQGGRILIKHIRQWRCGWPTWQPGSKRYARCSRAHQEPSTTMRRTPIPCATWQKCLLRRKSSRSLSTRSNCTAATALCSISASRRYSATPRYFCTWTPPSTYHASRS